MAITRTPLTPVTPSPYRPQVPYINIDVEAEPIVSSAVPVLPTLQLLAYE